MSGLGPILADFQVCGPRHIADTASRARQSLVGMDHALLTLTPAPPIAKKRRKLNYMTCRLCGSAKKKASTSPLLAPLMRRRPGTWHCSSTCRLWAGRKCKYCIEFELECSENQAAESRLLKMRAITFKGMLRSNLVIILGEVDVLGCSLLHIALYIGEV